jgi:hypothetical protein
MKLTIVLVLAFATATFAQEQPPPSQAAPPIARVHVYRLPQFVGSALFPSIYVDGEQVARVGNGRRVTIKLTPGSHNIKSDDKGSAITLDVKAGQEYFIRLDEVQGMMKGKGKVTLVSSDQGAPEYNLQRPIEESRVIAPEMVESGGGRLVQVPSAQLEADITRTIRVLEATDHPGCALQIVKQSYPTDKPDVGRWDVKSCDTASSYDVVIVPSPKGGSDFRVVKSVQEQQQKQTDTAALPSGGSRAGAPDASPEELVPYEGQKSQFTISLPKGWVAQDQSQTPGMNGNSRFNLILFHPSYPNVTGQDAKSVELMAMKLLTGIDSGEIPSFFVQRVPAKNGMSCAGLSEKGEKDVFKMITGDPILGKGAAILEAPRSEPISVAGCKGIRIRGTGQPAKENAPQTLDVYAVSDGNVLYLFTLRNHADNYKRNVDIFEKSVATVRLTATK